MLKAMKSKVFEIKHRSPLWLSFSLRGLGSGVRGSRMDHTDREGLNTITVRDFPENLGAIEEAIKRLDVPASAAKVQEVELQVQVLFASRHSVPEGAVPDDLQPVIKSLKGALAYRGYTLAATFVQRWDLSNGRMIQGKGQVDGASLGFGTAKDPSTLRIEWEASPANGAEPKLIASSSLQIPKFQLEMKEPNSSGNNILAKIETSVNLKEGEHVVVGTSVIKDQGLVVVLTAKQLK
ncbi:MAG: hypothetical protein U0P46_01360 [Holophagaceae bacterium]